jgi:hypothetical protein
MPEQSGENQTVPARRESDGSIGANDRIVVDASGKGCISECIEFRRILLDALDHSNWVEVDCSGLIDADLTFFQLLCSANFSASKNNRRFTLRGIENAHFVALAHKIGLVRHERGTRDTCQHCIWSGEGEI